jgi:hypothetical protein
MPAVDIDVTGLPCLSIEERNNLPQCPAVYLVLECESVIYIGRAKNLLQRWRGHHRLYELQQLSSSIRIAWLQCSDATLLSAIESALITQWKPRLNRARVKLRPTPESERIELRTPSSNLCKTPTPEQQEEFNKLSYRKLAKQSKGKFSHVTWFNWLNDPMRSPNLHEIEALAPDFGVSPKDLFVLIQSRRQLSISASTAA